MQKHGSIDARSMEKINLLPRNNALADKTSHLNIANNRYKNHHLSNFSRSQKSKISYLKNILPYESQKINKYIKIMDSPFKEEK